LKPPLISRCLTNSRTAWHKLPEAEESEYGENNNDCSDQPDDVVHALLPCRQMCSAEMAEQY
jgi:hypothetical protein